MSSVDRSDWLNASNDNDGKAILAAYRFLESVAAQVEALREAIRHQLTRPGNSLQEAGYEVSGLKNDVDDRYDKHGWFCRTSFDTFDIKKSKGKAMVFRCAIQISLAPRPRSQEVDDEFFPHVAIIVYPISHGRHWACRAEDDFILDNEYLSGEASPADWEGVWMYGGKLTWIDEKTTDIFVFAVPLVWLSNTNDVQLRVVDRLRDLIQEKTSQE